MSTRVPHYYRSGVKRAVLGLLPQAAWVGVQTDKDAYVAGEAVGVKVVVRPKTKALHVKQGWVALVCEYERKKDLGDATQSVYERVESSQLILEDEVLQGRREIELTRTLPATQAPTGKASITSVEWLCEARLAIPRRLDAVGISPLRLLSTRGLLAARGEQEPERSGGDDLDLSLELPSGRHVSPGEEIVGTFHVRAPDATGLGSVRVELVRDEAVTGGALSSNFHHEIADVAHLGAPDGIPTPELPFRLRVPDDACPCIETPHTTVSWKVRGVVSRQRQPDAVIGVHLNLFTHAGPP